MATDGHTALIQAREKQDPKDQSALAQTEPEQSGQAKSESASPANPSVGAAAKQEVPASPNSSPQAETPKKGRSSVKKLAVIAALIVLSAVGVMVFQYLSCRETTDDAYVTGHLHPVSARVEANVEVVLVDDNDLVRAGQTIIKLDPRDLQKKVDEAEAAVRRAEEQIQVDKREIALSAKNAEASQLDATGLDSGYASAIEKSYSTIKVSESAILEQQSVIVERESELKRALDDYNRYEKLEGRGAVTTSSRDSARRDYEVALAARDAALRSLESKKSQLEESKHSLAIARAQKVQSQGALQKARALEIQTNVSALRKTVSEATAKEARTRLSNALLQLSYTEIKAPADGRIGRKNIEVGQHILPGGQLLMITENDVWVVANFKETQLEHMFIGQKAEVKIDAFPHHQFMGKIDSFSPGSGAEYALLPPDNATGNFTKIVQRVPVKIRLNADDVKQFENRLVPGLSAVVTVFVK